MEHKVFKTKGVCSTRVSFDYEDGKIYNVEFLNGCNGNLRAIALLIEGKDMNEIVNIFEGHKCGRRNTSCAEQLAIAIKEVI